MPMRNIVVNQGKWNFLILFRHFKMASILIRFFSVTESSQFLFIAGHPKTGIPWAFAGTCCMNWAENLLKIQLCSQRSHGNLKNSLSINCMQISALFSTRDFFIRNPKNRRIRKRSPVVLLFTIITSVYSSEFIKLRAYNRFNQVRHMGNIIQF